MAETIVFCGLVRNHWNRVMKRIAGFLLFAVMACFLIGAMAGCETTGKKKDNGLSTTMDGFFNSDRVQP